MSEDELGGVIVPVITPVDADDRLDEEAFRSHLRRLIGAGVHGIFAGGTAGEGPLLTNREWQRTMEVAYEECHGKVHLLGGALETSTARAMERIAILEAIGYRHYVVIPSFYFKVKLQEEHLRFFGKCREAGRSMNMVAYNIPSCAGSAIAVETMCEMARRGWIQCCKESSGDMTYLGRLLSEARGLGLGVLIGTELEAAQGLRMGAQGLVPMSANLEPGLFVEAYASRDDEERLAGLQDRIAAMVRTVVLEPRSWLAGVKYAVAAGDGGRGDPVSPTEPLNESERARIDAFLRARS